MTRRSGRAGTWCVLALTALLLPRPAGAAPASGGAGDGQGGPAAPRVRAPERPHAFDLSLGGQWVGSTSLGESAATETPNQIDPSGPFVLFRSSARLQGAPGLEARLGFALTDTFAIEGGVAYSRPAVRVSLSGDFEQAPDVTFDSDRLNQVTVDGALLVHLRGLAFAGRRGMPFVLGGGGYLRQLHEGNALLDTGQIYYVGGGVKYLWSERPGRRLSGVGLRLDARATYRRRGYALEDKGRFFPVASAGLLLAF